ncbi:hypothetical protein KP509_13G036000 [Ceratopteris richardii]|uniref:Heterokaryon incompatibility domain-containing protein n=1 Tax=Ceratopteris richardii TaxID=49495 RepID=A0A8T2THW6_CERRI|nr:hypothetical protein KP509_13G036000 [Ceratopteris richardii]
MESSDEKGGSRLPVLPTTQKYSPLSAKLPKIENTTSYVIPMNEPPLRLIDVRRTLESHGGICFSRPRSWPTDMQRRFHVLSHTWSLRLKNFSKEIGKVASCTGNDKTTAYEEGFRKAQLNDHRCYQEFMKLLEILRDDGVEHFWYDMLCINQADDDKQRGEKADGDKERGEKATEIPNMASYYRYNMGCYVLMHGVGNGYHLWNPPSRNIWGSAQTELFWKGSPRSVPRWFHRVWTFQEYVFPQRLIFIVEGLRSSTKERLNKLIHQDSPCKMLCRCVATDSCFEKVPDLLREEVNKDIKGREGVNDDIASVEMLSASSEEPEVLGAVTPSGSLGTPCSKCGREESLIRKVENRKDLYFVNEQAFFLLVDLDWGPADSRQREFFNTLMELRLLGREMSSSVSFVVDEVAKRQCTREEDRVLSILGFLQVDGKCLIRTDMESVEPQLQDLPKKLDAYVLVQLCLASGGSGSYESSGISWAPNLRFFAPKYMLFDIPRFPFHINRFSGAEVNLTTAEMHCGQIKFDGFAVQGTIGASPGRSVLVHKYDPLVCYFCRQYIGDPACSSVLLHQIKQCDLRVGNDCRMPIDIHFMFVRPEAKFLLRVAGNDAPWNEYYGYVEPRNGWFYPIGEEEEYEDIEMFEPFSCGFPLNLPYTVCAHSMPSFNVWLLHMGSLNFGGSNQALLICLGNIGTGDGNQLHKLGTIYMSEKNWKNCFSQVDHLTEYVLGGFGKSHVHKLWNALPKPWPVKCNCRYLHQVG